MKIMLFALIVLVLVMIRRISAERTLTRRPELTT